MNLKSIFGKLGGKKGLKYDWYRHSYLEIVVHAIPIEFYFEKCMI